MTSGSLLSEAGAAWKIPAARASCRTVAMEMLVNFIVPCRLVDKLLSTMERSLLEQKVVVELKASEFS
jgi:hypothetical protein